MSETKVFFLAGIAAVAGIASFLVDACLLSRSLSVASIVIGAFCLGVWVEKTLTERKKPQ